MMKVLGIDFETTGLDPKQDRITEVGAVLWDWQAAVPVCLLSSFVNPERPIPAEVSALTGITDQMIDDYGKPERDTLDALDSLIYRADYVMAHNGTTFDKPFLSSAYARCGMPETSTPWLDSKTDIRYPEHITIRNLRYLATEHGFLNPFAHRAVFDVLTMLRVASNYPIEDIIARAKEPTVFARAIVSFDDKEKAKARGYYWCAPQRIWWRSFKESDYLAEKDACGFSTAVMEKPPE